MNIRLRYSWSLSLVCLLGFFFVGAMIAYASSGPGGAQSTDDSAGQAAPKANRTDPCARFGKQVPQVCQKQSPPASVEGIPAITPSKTSTTAPTFTAADVARYYQNHMFSAGPTVSGGPPTITSVRFITAKEASALLSGQPIGQPDSAMVCYVQLRGPFYPKLVSVPPGQPLPATVATGFAVFDAQTGNLLLWGLT